jgi:quinol-cytochrome oxidoreductase complex cytochrome b subunit/mono/diheme cytochrome c family protein
VAKILDWVDDRIGYRKFMRMMLLERIPGGARWRYIWGSCLTAVFAIQLITGILLMTAYSASATNAWGSVHYIQYKMDFGWLIRGLHHFGSQTMVVLLGLHMLQVVIAGAQLPPREFNWWTGLLLMGCVLGLSLTGYLLPWDQKGYYATQVATNIAGQIPILGTHIKAFLIGGDSYGNATLTRFFSFHVWILPGMLIGVLVIHLALFRRHGVTAPGNEHGEQGKEHAHAADSDEVPELPKGDGWFWPDQAFLDMLAILGVFGIMLTLVVFGGHGHKIESKPQELSWTSYDYWAKAGTRGWGANLDAPADRNAEGYPARPEWYFLFLFQLLKYFEGEYILIGTLAIPVGVKLLLFILPLLGHGRMRAFGRFFGIVVVVALLGSVAALTALALADDSEAPWPGTFGVVIGGATEKAKDFNERRRIADIEARRACNVAYEGIPVEGDVTLARNDPLIQGPKLFKKATCSSCHSYTPTEDELKLNDAFLGYNRYKVSNKLADDAAWKDVPKDIVAAIEAHFGTGADAKATQIKTYSETGDFVRDLTRALGKDKFDSNKSAILQAALQPSSAPDLGGYGGKAWIKRVLDAPQQVFGQPRDKEGEPLLGGMIGWRAKIEKKRKKMSAEEIKQQDQEFDLIAEWLADQRTPRDDREGHELHKKAFPLFEDHCASCHTYKGSGGGTAPDFTDYASAGWIRKMIASPDHPDRFGEKNQMPAFRDLEAPGADLVRSEFKEIYKKELDPVQNNLSDLNREIIVRWLTQDYRVVFGGQKISGVEKRVSGK